MSDTDLIALVAKMRELQHRYFRTRSREVMALSMEVEKKVDAELKARQQVPDLFEN